jgi:hypothetical protein
MDGLITRRALVKGGLIAGAFVPVAGLFISGAAHADLPGDSMGSCALFAGRSVALAGWCG